MRFSSTVVALLLLGDACAYTGPAFARGVAAVTVLRRRASVRCAIGSSDNDNPNPNPDPNPNHDDDETSSGGGELLRARLALFATSVLWGTYPVSVKLVYAAEGAALTPITVTAIRFFIMAVVAQVVLAQPSAAALEEQEEAAEVVVEEEAEEDGSPEAAAAAENSKAADIFMAADTSAAATVGNSFWINALELGFWGCAGTQVGRCGSAEP